MYIYFAILPILSTLLCVGLGLFTFSRNPRHPINIGFTLAMVSLATIEAGNTIVLISSAERQMSLLGMRISLIGQAILPAACLLFTLLFARANYKEILFRWAFVLAGVSTVSILFGVLIGSPKFISLSSSHPHFILGPIGRYFYIYLIMGLVLNLIQLENTLRSSSGSKRWQIKYVIFGVGAILSFFIYVSSQALLFSAIDIQLIPVISAVILISTAIMALFIVRHRLLDVDIFVSRYVIYNSLTILIVGIYLISVGLITYGIRYFNIPFDYFFITLFIFISILALVILLFTTTLRRKVQLFINRHFYKHKYEFRDKWMETIEKISPKRLVEEIHNTLVETISETMGARDVYLWLSNGDYFATRHEMPDDYKRIDRNHVLIRQIEKNKGPFLLKDIEYRNPGLAREQEEMKNLVNVTGAVLCTPLLSGQDLVGFVLQGKDISGESYMQDDFEFLRAITTQAAVQIRNIELTQNLMKAKEIEAFSNMSSFIMHDLKNLTNSLSLLGQNARRNIDNPEFQRDAIKTIEDTVSRMKGLIEKLSAVPKGLAIKKETLELNDLIQNALKKVVMHETKNVAITKEIKGAPLINVDPEAMEMVFLNIFTNAYEAIQKEGKIRVQSVIGDGCINVTVSDNGVGMSKEFIEKALFQPFKTTKKGGFGIGLYQCKAIVEAHGGRIEVESEEGKGTSIWVKLPLGDRV